MSKFCRRQQKSKNTKKGRINCIPNIWNVLHSKCWDSLFSRFREVFFKANQFWGRYAYTVNACTFGINYGLTSSTDLYLSRIVVYPYVKLSRKYEVSLSKVAYFWITWLHSVFNLKVKNTYLATLGMKTHFL